MDDRRAFRRLGGLVVLGTIAAGAVALASGSASLWAGTWVLLAGHVPTLFGAWCLAGRLSRPAVGPHSLVAQVVLAGQIYFAGLVALGLLLGQIGLLTRPAALVSAVALGVTMMWVSRGFASLPDRRVHKKKSWPEVVAITALSALAILVAWKSLTAPIYEYDVLTYHLMFPARWIQDAAVSIIPTWFGDPAPAYAPCATEIYYAWLMLPVGSDLVARGGQFAFWMLLLLAAGGLGRELGLRRAERTWACLALAFIPALTAQAVTAMVDVALAAHLVAVVMFALRAGRSARIGDIVGLLLSLGLLLGTKFIALAYLAAILPLLVWSLARITTLLARRLTRPPPNNQLHYENHVPPAGHRPGGRPSAAPTAPRSPWGADSASLSAVLVLALGLSAWVGGFWYVRNWAVTGNPVYPLEVKVGSAVLFDGAYGRAQMENSIFNVRRRARTHPFGQTLWEATHLESRLATVNRQPSIVHQQPARSEPADRASPSTLPRWYLGPTGLVAVLFIGAALRALRRGPRRLPLLLFYAGVATSGLVFWYVLPFQQPRFFWGPMALALIGAAALARAHPYAPPVLLLAAGLTWGAHFAGELYHWLAPPAPALLAAVLLGAGWIALRRKPRLTRFLPLCFIAGPLVGIAVAASTGDQPRARTMAAPRWRFFGEAWTWIEQNLRGATIAYAGNNVPYFLCGPRLENRVLYVPARKPVWGRYHDFGFLPETRSLGPPHTSEPAVDRYVMDPAVWLDNLQALGVEYVLVNSMFPNLLINYRHDLEGFPVERRWLDALGEAPPDAAMRAQCRVFGGGSVRLYRLHFAEPRQHPSPSLGPLTSMFSPVIRDETDALARRRQDATPPGRPIRDYPHAAAVIQRAGLQTLEP